MSPRQTWQTLALYPSSFYGAKRGIEYRYIRLSHLQHFIDKTTPRLIQFHTLKNAVNPPFLGGFSVFGTVAAEAEQRSCQGDSLFSMILCNDRKAIVTE